MAPYSASGRSSTPVRSSSSDERASDERTVSTSETARLPDVPSVVPPRQAPERPPQAQEAVREPILSIEEARATLTESRDRQQRELRAIDRLLGAIRVADADKGRLESDVRELRERLRRRETELDELKTELDRTQAESAQRESLKSQLDGQATELRSEVERLQNRAD